MSTRERWIVYPLLFLTLGIAMRDRPVSQGHFRQNELRAGRLHCDELLVDGPNGRPTVIARTDPTTKGGSIITLSAAGVPLVLLQPGDSGGVVLASDFVHLRLTGVAPQKPKTPATPVPKKPSKTPEKTPAKANK
jgi:hypothetical protein